MRKQSDAMQEDMPKEKTVPVRKSTLILLFCLCGVLAVGTGLGIYRNYAGNTEYRELRQLAATVKQNYYTDVDDEAVMQGAMKGYVAGLDDPYSQYMTSEEYQAYQTEEALLRMQETLPVHTEIIALDLAENQAPFTLYEFCRDKHVDILVNNAGFGVFGKFSETALQEELELLQVNVRALHILTKLFLRDFKKRNFGKILNVASSAGFLTGPLFSSYYASKNYVVRLSLAIAEELRREKSRVTISILCPGPVDTGFNDRAGVQFRVKALTPEAVAKEAVFGLLTGKLLIIPGLMMRVGVAASKLVPEKLLSRILYHVQAAKQPEHK